MKSSEILRRILDWEQDAGESFFDYFCHDTVKDSSWAFFLLGKGLNKHGNAIINEILNDNECIDQGVLYEIKPEYIECHPNEKYSSENYEYNLSVMAEFISCTKYYTDLFIEFLKED